MTKKNASSKKSWKQLLRSRKKSKMIAKERLRVLLVSDRMECSPETLELMKAEIIKVISKFMEIHEEEMMIQIKQTTPEGKSFPTEASICATIPIKI